jgi:hypothetical protein
MRPIAYRGGSGLLRMSGFGWRHACARLRSRRNSGEKTISPVPSTALIVTNGSLAANWVGLIIGLFAARSDVFAA